jgi:hypothetical protein
VELNFLIRTTLPILNIIEKNEPIDKINKEENLNVNSLIGEVESILKFKNVKNINYGMSKKKDLMPDKTFKRWVIPYLRKDTPVENSNFSSILVTLVLTIKYFQENDYKFEEEDLHNIYQKDEDFFINENMGNVVLIKKFNSTTELKSKNRRIKIIYARQ